MKQTTNNLLLTFLLKLRFKKIWKMFQKTPFLPPPYVPPPLLTAKEVEVERNKISKHFNKTSLQMSKDELDAANEFADQKNKKIIRQN